jgi:ubiquinone/menaquinone biosynthesis C-methylase UbiE
MSESNLWDERRVAWKEWVKRRLVALYSGALVGGRPQGDYLAKLGMPQDRIFSGYDAIENDYFARNAGQSRKQEADYRSRYGLPEKYFLASARFLENKNLPRLLEAYARYRTLCEDQRPQTTGPQDSSDIPLSSSPVVPWSLVLLGDGPLRPALNSQLSTLNLHGHVLLPGFKQYPDLPAYYGLAGAFIHASTTEQWGLVVNEAMASGLPVLVSNRCGCASDLVQEGVNGFTFEPDHADQLAQLMRQIAAFDFPLSAFGAASQAIVARFGPPAFASGLRGALEVALASSRPRPRILDSLLLGVLSSARLESSRRPVRPCPPAAGSGAKCVVTNEEHAAVENLFTESTAQYSELFRARKKGSNFGFRRRWAIAMEMSRAISGSLLDCACGTGEITASVLKTGRFDRAVVVDISQRMLDRAEQRIRAETAAMKPAELEFACADVFEFAAQSASCRFDLILCLGLIAHTGRLAELLASLKGILADDGAVLLQSTLLDHPGTGIVRAFSRERYFRRHGYRISYYRHKDIAEACDRAGLRITACNRYLAGFPFGDRIWAWGNYQLEAGLSPLARRYGSEAIYLLKRDGHA